uniref:Uncharacterized protein n=1 Tax=Glossina palpalis gambiensis TaxID=67801 RepID=A0A1B0BFN6_9MUSC
MSALLWILTLSVQISLRISLGSCIILVVLFHFFTLTNFFWMLVEVYFHHIYLCVYRHLRQFHMAAI